MNFRKLYAYLRYVSCGVDPRTHFFGRECLCEERMVLHIQAC